MGHLVDVTTAERVARRSDERLQATRRAVDSPPSRNRRRVDRVSAATLAIGLLVTAVLVASARAVRDHTDEALLRQRTREGGLVLSAALPSLQLPLSTGATLAESTNGDAAAFEHVFEPLTGPKGIFVNVSLFDRQALDRSIASVGVPREAETVSPPVLTSFLASRSTKSGLGVLSLLNAPERRAGYALSISPSSRFVVYAEQALSTTQPPAVAGDQAFSGLGFGLFVGNAQDPRSLIWLTAGEHVPIRGKHSTVNVPFGDTNLLLVVTPKTALSGDLMARLPWILAIGGTFLSLLCASLVERLARRRNFAESLAGELNLVAAENALLYERQREVAAALQHSLLPEALPQLEGVEISGRFAAGTPGMEIGGDWYDVIETGPQRCVFIVGDVSGRGVRAGTIMAKLRYAARAYAVAGDAPNEILDKLSMLVSVRDGHFATVLCGDFDGRTRRVRFANAGHLPAVLLADRDVTFVATAPGVPIGVTPNVPYDLASVALGDHGTLLAFTDGLVERRGESIDVGLERAASFVRGETSGLDELMDRMLDEIEHGDDDTAMLGLRWNL